MAAMHSRVLLVYLQLAQILTRKLVDEQKNLHERTIQSFASIYDLRFDRNK